VERGDDRRRREEDQRRGREEERTIKRAEDHRRRREIKLPQTKNQYEKPIKKTPNQHTQSILQKRRREIC